MDIWMGHILTAQVPAAAAAAARGLSILAGIGRREEGSLNVFPPLFPLLPFSRSVSPLLVAEGVSLQHRREYISW